MVLHKFACFLLFNQIALWSRDFLRLSLLKPRAKGCNFDGQQLPTLLNVKCCVRLRTLLHVVAKSGLKPVKRKVPCSVGQQLPTLLGVVRSFKS